MDATYFEAAAGFSANDLSLFIVALLVSLMFVTAIVGVVIGSIPTLLGAKPIGRMAVTIVMVMLFIVFITAIVA